MLAGENHAWAGMMTRLGLALLVIIVLALPLLDALTR